MPPHEILARARAADSDLLSTDRTLIAEAVAQLAQAEDAAGALELMALTWRVWLAHDQIDLGSSLASAALSARGAETVAPWRARTLYADGLYAFRAGETERSRSRNAEALQGARETRDPRGECDALTGLARVALREGRYDEVVRLARMARDRARESGDGAAEASPLHLEAAGVRLQQDYRAARDLYLASLRLNGELGNPASVAMEHHNLGWVELHIGDAAAAEAHFRERDARSAPDAYGDAWTELNRAGVAILREDWDDANRRLESGTAALANLGGVLDPDDQFELDWLYERLRTRTC